MGRRKRIPRVPHWVYFLINKGKIVYIGCTSNLLMRMKFHKDKEHDAVRVFKYDNKWTALHYERRWTKFLIPHPIHNRFPFYYGPDELERFKRLGCNPNKRVSLTRKQK